ncbi:unnamed protein product [Dibothriocephalus latus]|uniref:Uncharacterized protein n=1 Tax=Dibothriocephalus latus TaxID=60516 RepID=A0A3P7NV90_DIBLA|nr:unnamed protein product [Dibothriocephalus latus]
MYFCNARTKNLPDDYAESNLPLFVFFFFHLKAEFQVDDVKLDILQFAASSKYGFLYTASDVASPSGVPCASNMLGSPPQPSISFDNSDSGDSASDAYLHLRMPHVEKPADASTATHMIHLDISIPSPPTVDGNQFLLLIYSSLPRTVYTSAVSEALDIPRKEIPLMILELRAGRPWLCVVNGPKTVNATTVGLPLQPLDLNMRRDRLRNILLEIRMSAIYAINGSLGLLITTRQFTRNLSSSAGISVVSFGESEPFRAVPSDWVEKVLRRGSTADAQAVPGTERFVFGRNILLGGSNWTAEDRIGRLPPTVWSALGARRSFRGCINR